jgi:heptosyltransferase III
MLRPGAHVLIFRTDGIGDLILTLPVATALKRHDPGIRVTAVTQEYTAPLAHACTDVDDVVTIPSRDVRGSVADFTAELRALQADAAVFCYPRPRLAAAAAMAGIPLRAGTAFRLYAPVFNRRLRQHRRGGDLHERDYNLSLLALLGVPVDTPPLPHIEVDEGTSLAALETLDWDRVFRRDRFAVLHPGSGGSARDWPPEMFGALAGRLVDKYSDLVILISGAEDERELVREVLLAARADRVQPLLPMPLAHFADALRRASLVVSNSTGPLHMAAAQGTATLGLYPFEPGLSPRRWGPLGERVRTLTPPQAPGCANCVSGRCAAHDRMEAITVEAVFEAACGMLDTGPV